MRSCCVLIFNNFYIFFFYFWRCCFFPLLAAYKSILTMYIVVYKLICMYTQWFGKCCSTKPCRSGLHKPHLLWTISHIKPYHKHKLNLFLVYRTTCVANSCFLKSLGSALIICTFIISHSMCL